VRGQERTHCLRGHPLSGDNVRFQKKGRWMHRVCRACQEIGRRAYTIRRVHRALQAKA
jgi:hypothetical protein